MIEHVRRVLAQRMATWTRTPIAWPGGKLLDPKDAPWVRYSMDFRSRHIPSTPRDTTRVIDGVVAIQVFTPIGGHDGECFRLAEHAGALFSGFSKNGVNCLEPEAPKIVGDEGHGWFQINVVIPFRARRAA